MPKLSFILCFNVNKIITKYFRCSIYNIVNIYYFNINHLLVIVHMKVIHILYIVLNVISF